MSDSTLSEDSFLDDIAHRFLNECEQGETPDFEAYLREYPEHTEQLHEIFSGFAILAGTCEKKNESSVGIANSGMIIDGKYKLIEAIGAGGMGQVWLSQQIVGLKRQVAIKLIKAGMDSERVLARFESERQSLALMNHPNIATVFDAGMTEHGRPYFAMEYVKGVPITEYCDRNRLRITERLRLFAVVCEAVLHSHQKGIIHRDLKPSNILICLFDGVPVPKVIDFGLAKAMDPSQTEISIHTGHREFVGTLLYTSPEQAEFNNVVIDIRSDVYSLGVVLYELLVGTTPLEKLRLKEIAETEALRQIREVDPQRPSVRYSGSGESEGIAQQRLIAPNELKSTLQRELDWIVMCALDKDRSRRYQSASEFKEDIERFLRGEPLVARPPSNLYRLSKFVKRKRGAVASALAVIVGIVALVAWMSVDLYHRRVLEKRINISHVEYLRAADAISFSRRLNELKATEHSSFVSRLNSYQLAKPSTTEIERRRDIV
ncbi:MAG: serine/threonine-protein kinase [Planctomycetota bacterium]|nr:serine/threonine-protein kinase [Planctomycetota bacterium]